MKKNSGITLIALIITIIIMLILVAVTISIVINSGIIGKAKESSKATRSAYEEEQNIGKSLNVGGMMFNSVDDYLQALEDGIAVPIINYGDKTAATVDIGDTITIGNEETGVEMFEVLKKSADGKTITTIPYYNLKLDENPIKQATAENASSAGIIKFSSISSPTWNANENVDLNNNVNNVISYIEAYEETLKNMGANNVTTCIGRYYGNVSDPDYVGNLSGKLNPSYRGSYWLGSTVAEYDGVMVDVSENGRIVGTGLYYGNSSHDGVRPLVIINL